MAMAGDDVTTGKATMAWHNDSLRWIITMAMGYQIMPQHSYNMKQNHHDGDSNRTREHQWQTSK